MVSQLLGQIAEDGAHGRGRRCDRGGDHRSGAVRRRVEISSVALRTGACKSGAAIGMLADREPALNES